MNEVSVLRLYILRVMYAFIAVGLGLMIWPLLFAPADSVSHLTGVVRGLLSTVALLALVGVRYPLRMLPLLFFELLWKAIWVLAYGLPLWLGQKLDASTGQTLSDCLVGLVLVPIAIPWGYTVRHYFKAPADRWK